MRALLATIAVCCSIPAGAQSLVVPPGYDFRSENYSFPRSSVIDSANDYIAVARSFPNANINGAQDVLALNFGYLRVSDFLAGSANSAALSSRIDALSVRFDSIQRDVSRLAEGIAMGSAMTVLPPNPGDRFFVSVTGAGYDNQAAGAINASMRLNDRTLAYGGYARSANQNLVKGGLGISFR